MTSPVKIYQFAHSPFASLTWLNAERKFGPGCIERWIQKRGNLVAEATDLLSPFEQTLAYDDPFLFGKAPVYSDFPLFGILENFTFRDAATFPADLPALKVWRARLTSFRYLA